ncbi:MAG: hypothetical protein QW607_05625 [Desulfurococcaceae archaeon]
MPTPIPVWQTTTGGAFQDPQITTRWLNVLRRNIVMYAFAQNLPKISAFANLLLKRSDSQPFQPDFIIQPVYGGLSGTAQENAQPSWVDATTGTLDIKDFNVDVLYAKFTPCILAKALRLNFFELAIMDNPNVIIDTLAVKTTEVHMQMLLTFMQAIMGTRGTDDKKFYGIFDIVDNGVYQPNYGGLDRGIYPWWNAPVYLGTNYTADNPPLFRVIKRVIKDYAKEHGNIFGMPAIAVTDYDTWLKIAESFMAIEQYVVGTVSEIAEERRYETKAINIDGIYIIPDAYLTTYEKTIGGQTKTCGRIFFVNLDYIRFTSASPFEFYMLDWVNEFAGGDTTKRLSFATALLLAGQFWSDRPRAHFRVDDIVLN